jgi:glycosyltransferase involved in cell wall biosynthesis
VEKVCTALTNAGHEIIILARNLNDQPSEDIIGNLKILRLGRNKPSFYSIPLSSNPFWKNFIKNAFREYKPDLVISREIMLAEAAANAAHKYSIPIIMDMAEHYPAAMKGFKKHKNNPFTKLLVHHLNLPENVEKNSVNKMDAIITVCQEQVDRLEKEYGFHQDKMCIVHNTPKIEWYDNISKGCHIPPIVFGHHGWMSGEKSLKELVIGFATAAKKDKEISLLLAGSGECYDDLVSLSRETGYSKRINFTGKYNFDELISILSKIDIGIIPYPPDDFNNHTIHNKLFDYFAAGKPVIVSEAKPMKRLIEETGAGISVNTSNPRLFAEAILNMKSMDLKKMSENALKAFNEKYNWETDSVTLIKFVEKIISH